MTPLSQEQIRHLRGEAHKLKPYATIGAKGLTESVQAEIKQALYDHSLIKIKIAGQDREQRQTIVDSILNEQEAQLIHQIGHVIVIYRKSEKDANKKSTQARPKRVKKGQRSREGIPK